MRVELERLLAWIREHGCVEASLVSGTVHVISRARGLDGCWVRELAVVSTYGEARAVLGY